MEDFEEMEMPTPCDCGEWFDLTEGFLSRNGKTTICGSCREKEIEIEDLEDEIEDLELWIANGEEVLANKKLLKELKLKLEKLNNS